MPPPSIQRRPRTRQVGSADPHDEMPDSSPSHPRTKRRKVVSPIENTEIYSLQDHVNAVIASLAMPEGDQPAPVVSTQWANETNFYEHADGITAYAKVAGCNWTYYVKDLVIRIGRPPDTRSGAGTAASPTPPPLKTEDTVHIDLGPSKLVSRNHAIISYDGGSADGVHDWRIHVIGRNGVKIDDDSYKKDSTVVLRSGSVIEIGGVQMMFVLPNKTPVIAPSIRRRARLREYIIEEEVPLVFVPGRKEAHYDLDADVPINSLTPAPAPVEEEPVTAVAKTSGKRSRSNPQTGGGGGGISGNATAPIYQRGVLLEMTEDMDYSQDALKEIKPPYSYALMIAQAILSNESEQLTLASIYQFIMDKYSFYRHSNMGWQNSIRHNLSLNKAFRKIPRRTDEPGKGMKWELLPEHREEYIKKLRKPSKGGRLSLSQPGSPSSPRGGAQKTLQPQPVRPMHSLDDPPTQTAEGNGSPPRSVTPQPMPTYRVQPQEAYTPDRGSRLPTLHNPDKTLVDTPGPPIHHNTGGLGLISRLGGSTIPADGDQIPTSPIRRSNTFNDDDDNIGLSTLTPAPRRHHPRLAPPSTGRGQLPSSYLPTSSPAPFWKYIHFGSTPAKPDGYSPPKDLHSSSPPPVTSKPEDPPKKNSVRDLGSPLKDRSGGPHLGGPNHLPPNLVPPDPKDDEDDDGLGDFPGVDLARGFEKIGKYHVNGRFAESDGWA